MKPSTQQLALEEAVESRSRRLARLNLCKRMKGGTRCLACKLACRGYNELKMRAAAPASPTTRRLLCSKPAPLPSELPEADGVALA